MSCASPISQPSPPSLRMYMNANNILSPSCRSSVDEHPFSFAFLPTSSSSSPAKSRPVLTDILLQRHTNSPQSPLHRSCTALLSPRKCSKENHGSSGRSPRVNADCDALNCSPGKVKRASNQSVLSSPSPGCQPAISETTRHAQLNSPQTCGRKYCATSTRLPKQNVDNGGPIDGLCFPQNFCQPATETANDMRLQSPEPGNKVACDVAEKSDKYDVESGAPLDAMCSSPSPSPLKRKRPTKLSIPEFARLASFGKAKQFELPAHEPLSSEILSFEAPVFGVSCRKGRRDCMEDSHTALPNFQGKANQAFFGVFDGHGGKLAAQFAAANLAQHVATAIENEGNHKESLKNAMKVGYLAMDSEFLEKGLDSGACSISAYVKDGHLVVANAGDCKAVLCREGKAEALSNLHRPSNAKERQRIESLGGYVDCFHGVWRVQGTLAVTRGFGDSHLKKWISAEPEVRQLDITKGCEFLILASDGLWDNVNDQEAVDCVKEILREGEDEAPGSPISRPCKVLRKNNDTSIVTGKSESGGGTLKIDACNKLIHKACHRGNLDDITVMVVPLANLASSG